MAAPPPARAPRALMDEIVEEIILRLPPAEPASLVRAALVCKPWRGLISSPRFRRRFREFHRTPPMLGFICNTKKDLGPYVARFVPTSSSFRPPHADYRDWVAVDARHGYVLLSTVESRHRLIVVWNPMTDERWLLPPLVPRSYGWNATVLCAASGAGDHLDCLHGTFLVVLLSTDLMQTTMRVYTSESGSWSQQTIDLQSQQQMLRIPQFFVDKVPPAIVGNTIYFSIDSGYRIVSYDLATRETSVICLPPNFLKHDTTMMMVDWESQLQKGASALSLSLPCGDTGWTQTRVIELEKLFHAKALFKYCTPVGCAPGIFFFNTDDGLFSINLKSDQVKKELDDDGNSVLSVVPYMSFYTPEFRASNS